MVAKKVEIVNKMGFHMRPASAFVTAMSKYDSNINIVFNGKKINGKSTMSIMAGCIKCGSEVTVECDGKDEQAMLDEAVNMINSGFGEE